MNADFCQSGGEGIFFKETLKEAFCSVFAFQLSWRGMRSEKEKNPLILTRKPAEMGKIRGSLDQQPKNDYLMRRETMVIDA